MRFKGNETDDFEVTSSIPLPLRGRKLIIFCIDQEPPRGRSFFCPSCFFCFLFAFLLRPRP